jgi:mono/diheme cytochrome c family protein
MRWRTAILFAALVAIGSAKADPDNYVIAQRGRALAIAGDCVACHTAPGGEPFAGGLALATPFGVIMTPNITPDDATGIGRWTQAEFSRAMHEGRGRNGSYLYPAFPYPYFTEVTREDTDAIYDYLRTLAPVTNAVNRRTLPFPFSVRALMIGWNSLFFKPSPFVPDAQRSAEFNRGAYLVEGLGHCGACHTPLNAFGANKASQFLQGNRIDDWTAPNITNDQQSGLGKWSVDDIVQYLKNGQTRTTTASGPMRDVIENSTSKMAEADLKAIAVYLRERGSAGTPAPAAVPASDAGRPSHLRRYLLRLSHPQWLWHRAYVSTPRRQCDHQAVRSDDVGADRPDRRQGRGHRCLPDIAGDAVIWLSSRRQSGSRGRDLYSQQLGQQCIGRRCRHGQNLAEPCRWTG